MRREITFRATDVVDYPELELVSGVLVSGAYYYRINPKTLRMLNGMLKVVRLTGDIDEYGFAEWVKEMKKTFALKHSHGVVECKTDYELEDYLSADGSDPGFPIPLLSKLSGIPVNSLTTMVSSKVQDFRGTIFVKYSDIVSLSHTEEQLKCFLVGTI